MKQKIENLIKSIELVGEFNGRDVFPKGFFIKTILGEAEITTVTPTTIFIQLSQSGEIIEKDVHTVHPSIVFATQDLVDTFKITPTAPLKRKIRMLEVENTLLKIKIESQELKLK